MNLLLDSHVLLWYDDPHRMSKHVREVMRTSQAFVSAASIWELTLKQNIGKLLFAVDLLEFSEESGFTLLSITPAHAKLAGSLPLHHRDPFDRMLVAQAMLEGLTLVTHDATLSRYGVPILQV